ncbi:anti-sigma-F factor Fin [Oceanobacillus sp. CAU 1775]
MAVVYQCRHCNQSIGTLEENVLDEAILGIAELSREEKEAMLKYQSNGDLLVYAICEQCEEALMLHPHYHELDYFIQ